MSELQVKQTDRVAEEASTLPERQCDDGNSRPADGDRQESILARQVAEFALERESWELHRQQEVERLRREGDLLAEAWQRLEKEERSLLAERELLSRGVDNRSPNALPPVSQASTSEKPQADDYEQDHLAWMQFQQLRRECQRHNRPTT